MIPQLPQTDILYVSLEANKTNNCWWEEIISWSIYSGKEISEELHQKLGENLIQEIKNTNWLTSQRFEIKAPTEIKETKGRS